MKQDLRPWIIQNQYNSVRSCASPIKSICAHNSEGGVHQSVASPWLLHSLFRTQVRVFKTKAGTSRWTKAQRQTLISYCINRPGSPDVARQCTWKWFEVYRETKEWVFSRKSNCTKKVTRPGHLKRTDPLMYNYVAVEGKEAQKSQKHLQNAQKKCATTGHTFSFSTELAA